MLLPVGCGLDLVIGFFVRMIPRYVDWWILIILNYGSCLNGKLILSSQLAPSTWLKQVAPEESQEEDRKLGCLYPLRTTCKTFEDQGLKLVTSA